VLGSAMIVLEAQENGSTRRILFTGDLGRKNMPILNDPWLPLVNGPFDAMLLESTYGDRDHDPIETMENQLAEIIRNTAARGGKIIIPTFALERAQEIIYALKNLEMRQAIPNIPVFVDSPLTVNITEVFRMHGECFDSAMHAMLEEAGDPFHLNRIEYVRKSEDSIRINFTKGPAIIMSAAGMCEHGRILHHLKNNCTDPKNTILIVGFQAKNTLGRRIVERQAEIKIFGVNYPLNAEVRVMNSFSAHAGRTELIEFADRLKGHVGKVILVHGEDTAAKHLKASLRDKGLTDIHIQQEDDPVSFEK